MSKETLLRKYPEFADVTLGLEGVRNAAREFEELLERYKRTNSFPQKQWLATAERFVEAMHSLGSI